MAFTLTILFTYLFRAAELSAYILVILACIKYLRKE